MGKVKSVAIVAPCYNESDIITNFLDELQHVLTPTDCDFCVIIVDDKSTDCTIERLNSYTFLSPKFTLKVISLHYNMGHQEAIRQGLIYTNSLKANFDNIIVMDSDGEDDPNAIVDLLKMDPCDIIFIERGERKEAVGFKIGYFFYKHIFKFLTGKSISFGNFSMINNDTLESISTQNYFHYASFLSKKKVSIQKLKYDRRSRIDDKSKMSYQSLVFHGLYSIIEFGEEMLFTFIKFLVAIFLSIIGLIGYIIYSKFIAETAIPGWASGLTTSLTIICLIIINTVVIGIILLSIKKIVLQKNQSYDQVK